MFEKIIDNIFRIKVPLPQSPLGYLNSYVLKGKTRNLVIDTGLNRPECLQAMSAGLKSLGIALKNTDFFLTHMHSDHSGLAPTLSKQGAKIYCSTLDGEIINAEADWSEMLAYALANGFPAASLRQARDNHPGYKYRPQGTISFTTIKDKQCLQIGNFQLQAIHTPGHTPGHMCLWEETHRILFAGDHLLEEITPNISKWRAEGNPLQDYFQSLEKISLYPARLVLPGHRKLFSNPLQRIKALKNHHEQRLLELTGILAEEKRQTPYQIASKMKWDLDCPNWEAFPIAQKWFATAEAMAHLKYLEDLGKIFKEENNGLFFYSLLEP